MYFLDPDNLDTNHLGKAFPINISHGEVLTRPNFFGLKNVQLVADTGCTVDAALKSRLVQQELQRQTAVATNEIKTAAGVPVHALYFDKIIFDKKVYGHFILDDCPDDNLLGLRFMGRYLTTLNFPKQMMYLKSNAVEY